MPAAFRTALAAQGSLEVMARKSSHSPCIEVWPRSVFDAQVQARTADLDPFSLAFEKRMRKLVAHAHALQPDSEGRMIVPKELIEAADLAGDVVFSGRHSYFQIWNARHWAAALAADEEGEDA